MNDRIKIKGEMISQYIVDLMNGAKGKKSINNDFFDVAHVLEHPNDLPFHIEGIYPLREHEQSEDLRFALLRIQIYCEMNMNRDMEHFQRLHYVSETIENVLFGGLLKEGADLEDEEEEEEEEEKEPPKKKGKGKGKK